MFSDEIVTPQLLETYRASSRAKLAEEAFQQVSSGLVTSAGFIALRNQIIIEILMSNGCRAGGLLALTHGHINNIEATETSIPTVSVHLHCTELFI